MLSKLLKFIVIAAILFAIIFFGKSFIFKKNYNTFTVKKSGVVNSVSVNGFVVSDLISDLYFDASGKIKKVNFKTGDKIEMGDILAELEAEQEKRHLSEAKLLLEKADNNLKIINSLTEKEIKEFSIKLTNLDIELGEIRLKTLTGLSKRNAKIEELKIQNLQNLLTASDADLLSAEQKIDEIADKGEEEIEKSRQLLMKTMEEILSISSSTLAETDNILGIDNKEVNDQFEEYLGVLKRSVFKNAKLAYEQTKNDYSEFNNSFNLLNKSVDEKLDTEEKVEEEINIMPVVESANTLLLSIDNLLFKTRILLNNTETYELPLNKKRPAGDVKEIFTKDELNELKLMIDGRKNENSKKTNLIENQKESLVLTEKDLLIAQKKAQNEYDKINSNNQEIGKNLKAMQENLVKIKENDNFLIEAAELNLNKKRENLAAIKENDKVKIGASDLEKLSNKAKGILLLAQENLNRTKLKVPNNCIITNIKAEIGGNISPSQIFAIAISTQVIAEADILESNINKIEIGQKTIFNFADNLKFEEKSAGEIIAVDQNNKKITVALDEYSSNIIQFGMPIGLTIIIAQKNNVLTVPQNVIFKKKNKIMVKILINKKIQDVEIKTGIIGNNSMVEIVSGLKEGEEVIIL